jgi:hypothetical protein
MAYPTKIATCCYCGTRAALVLGKDRHELSCSSCGAPLHDLKRLKKVPEDPRPMENNRSESVYASQPRRAAYTPAPKRKKYKKYKRRKGFVRYLIEEAVDALEDIFD